MERPAYWRWSTFISTYPTVFWLVKCGKMVKWPPQEKLNLSLNKYRDHEDGSLCSSPCVLISLHWHVFGSSISAYPRNKHTHRVFKFGTIFTWTQGWTDQILIVKGQGRNDLLNTWIHILTDNISHRMCWLYSNIHIWSIVVHHKIINFADTEPQLFVRVT